MEPDSLGNRMKGYEQAFQTILPRRMPVIIRLDGKAFHSLTKHLKKPYDQLFANTMIQTAFYLCEEIQGSEVAYIQSDEISILLHNYKNHTTQPWFANEIQKMVSVSASLAAAKFNNININCPLACFDSRVFILPEAEVCNYFVWRQQDAVRNSIQGLSQSLYSHKELMHKNTKHMQEMCFQKGHNWNDLSDQQKRGTCIERTESNGFVISMPTPAFSQDRQYIEKHLAVNE